MNGTRTASRDFAEFFAAVLTEHFGFQRGVLERCLFVHETIEMRVVSEKHRLSTHIGKTYRNWL